MASYTTLVNVDDETAGKIAALVASKLSESESVSYISECSALIEKSNCTALIDKFLIKISVILTLESEDEIDSCFQAMFAIIYTLGEGANETPILRKIARTLQKDTVADTPTRLRAMALLLNLALTMESKFELANGLLEYALATQQSGAIKAALQQVDTGLTVWSLSVEQKQALLKLMAQNFQQSGSSDQALKSLIQYFNTFKGSALPANATDLALTAVVAAIKSHIDSFSERASLLESLAAQKFSGDLSSLIVLLQVLCDGSLGDYERFLASSGNVQCLNKHSVDVPVLTREMKLLSLCSLAAAHFDQRRLSYQQVVDALKVSAEEVEEWAIEAISEGLVDACIDQQSETIVVTRYSHRSFGRNDWQALQHKLRALRGNLERVVDAMHKATPVDLVTN